MSKENKDSARARPQKNGDVAIRRIGDDLILVPIRPNADDADSIFSLNDVGGRIWELIDGARTLAEIGGAIAEEYEVSEESAFQDVVKFTNLLASASFVTLENPQMDTEGHAGD